MANARPELFSVKWLLQFNHEKGFFFFHKLEIPYRCIIWNNRRTCDVRGAPDPYSSPTVESKPWEQKDICEESIWRMVLRKKITD